VKRIGLIFVCLFLLGGALRALNVWRPVDRTSWREADIAAIARNYQREGLNPFFPRIDWRGNGPGYAEMELPVLPWSMALLYEIFGVQVVIGRLLSYLFALLTLLVFFKLARYLLPPMGAVIASLFFVLSPIVVVISSALQSESLMLLAYVTAVYAFIRWLDDDSRLHFVLAICATAMAILAKASAAHIGLLFAFLLFQRQGFAALKNWRTWVFGIGSLLPGILWYRHAHKLYLTYGNSLGVSNETHWAGWDLFTNADFIRGILHTEWFSVWMPAGVLVVLFGLVIDRRARVVALSAAWFASVFVFYLIAARTTGDAWAFYYHVVAVPPVALLVGHGIEGARGLERKTSLIRLALILTAAISVLSLLVYFVGPGGRIQALSFKWAMLFGLTALLLLLLMRPTMAGKDRIGSRWVLASSAAAIAITGLLAATFLYQLRDDRDDLTTRKAVELLSCAESFAPLIPPGDRVVASGGPCVDPTGYPVAFNSSYMFYWMDRKGFNVCVENQSTAALDSLAQQGARYFVAEKNALAQKPGFEEAMRQRYPVVRECNEAVLFALSPDAK
jgi:4-amino-4-deoxy-L-arabinose transferase-like glycosyltransferase